MNIQRAIIQRGQTHQSMWRRILQHPLLLVRAGKGSTLPELSIRYLPPSWRVRRRAFLPFPLLNVRGHHHQVSASIAPPILQRSKDTTVSNNKLLTQKIRYSIENYHRVLKSTLMYWPRCISLFDMKNSANTSHVQNSLHIYPTGYSLHRFNLNKLSTIPKPSNSSFKSRPNLGDVLSSEILGRGRSSSLVRNGQKISPFGSGGTARRNRTHRCVIPASEMSRRRLLEGVRELKMFSSNLHGSRVDKSSIHVVKNFQRKSFLPWDGTTYRHFSNTEKKPAKDAESDTPKKVKKSSDEKAAKIKSICERVASYFDKEKLMESLKKLDRLKRRKFSTLAGNNEMICSGNPKTYLQISGGSCFTSKKWPMNLVDGSFLRGSWDYVPYRAIHSTLYKEKSKKKESGVDTSSSPAESICNVNLNSQTPPKEPSKRKVKRAPRKEKSVKGHVKAKANKKRDDEGKQEKTEEAKQGEEGFTIPFPVVGMERWIKKTAMVTGANSGIGLATCQTLACQGMCVVGVDKKSDKIEEILHPLRIDLLSQELEDALVKSNAPGMVCARICDVSVDKEVLDTFKDVKGQFGGCQVLVCSAGLALPGSLLEGDPCDWRYMMDVNLIALAFFAKEFVKDLVTSSGKEGHIIFIGSVLGQKIIPYDDLHFCMVTKHGVRALTEALRQELVAKELPIKISQVSPGYVATKMYMTMYEDHPPKKDTMISQYPENSLLTPDDIANAILYTLSSPSNVQVHDVVLRPKKQDI